MIDVLDAMHAETALNRIIYASPRIDVAKLDPQLRERLRATARRWVDAGWQARGVALGLVGDWPEFFDQAVDLLARPPPLEWARPVAWQEYAQRDLREMAWALERYWEPRPGDAARIKTLLLQVDDSEVRVPLLVTLYKTDRVHVVDTCRQLAVDKRPWVWWRALTTWADLPGDRAAMAASLPEPLKVRVELAVPPTRSARLAGDAAATLAALLTPEMAFLDPGAWSEVQQSIATRLDRRAATEAFLGFLRAMTAPATRQRLVRTRAFTYPAWQVSNIVRMLNVWYGVDLGGLGTDRIFRTERNEPRSEHELQVLIQEVLDWQAAAGELRPRPLVLELTVIDSAGRPVPDALLRFRKSGDHRSARLPGDGGPDGSAGMAEGRTDAAGRCRYTPSLDGDQDDYRVSVSAPGFATREGLWLTRQPDGRFRCDFGAGAPGRVVLQVPARLTGTLLGADGLPLSGVELRCWANGWYSPDTDHRLGVKTDARGRFTIEGLAAGAYFLSYCVTTTVREGNRSAGLYSRLPPAAARVA